MTKSKDHNWTSAPVLKATEGLVPPLPGIYAVALASRVFGIPTGLDILYVGRSLNLRRRFKQHLDPWRAHNQELSQALMSVNRRRLEFWYMLSDKDGLATVEKRAIRELAPKYNIVQYGDQNDHGRYQAA